jgi:hypothetical protein
VGSLLGHGRDAFLPAGGRLEGPARPAIPGPAARRQGRTRPSRRTRGPHRLPRRHPRDRPGPQGQRRHGGGRLKVARQGLALLAVLLLSGAALLVLSPTASAATTRTFTITGATAHPVHAFKTFDGNPPRTFDFNGDGRQEIIAQNDNQYAYVFDSATGTLLSEVTTTFPASWGARTFNGPEAYRDGGVSHLVIQNSAAEVTSFRYDAAGSTATHFNFVKEWERHLTDCFSNPGSDSKPVLVDLDKDGHYEILASTEESGLYALRADTGAIYWKKCIGGGNAEMASGDLNQDGWPDVVFGSDGGIVTAMNGRTGATMWGYSILAHFNLQSASMPVGGAIGQIDGVGGLDYVVGARDSHDATNWTNDHSLLLALSTGGSVLWAKQDPTGNPLTYTHPIIADADHDGQSEVYWGDWNTIGHKPPYTEADSWKVTGPAHFYRYDKAGNMVWRQTLGTFWSNKDLALADVDGDGQQEILATGPNTNGHEGIFYLDIGTGAKKTFVDAYPWMVARGPVIADLAGNGHMQWILEVGPYATTEGAAVQVYDTGVAYDAMWPHVPEYPLGPASTSTTTTTTPTTTTTTTTPPPGACFAASFTIKAPNEWWQELYPSASGHSITSAQVRVNGGAWQAMSFSSWGAWTSSVHSVSGSQVEFMVHDSANGQSTSQPFTWLDGTLTKASVACPAAPASTTTTTSAAVAGTSAPPPPPGSFKATFTPQSVGNDTWVGVAVDSAHLLSLVEAQLNGSSWVPLSPTAPGTWGKSLPAPDGTVVVFRATDDAGATAVSGPVVWT